MILTPVATTPSTQSWWWTRMWSSKKLGPFDRSCLISFSAVTIGYTIEGDRVFYTHHYVGRCLLDGADAASFTTLTDPTVVGTDKQNAHYAGKDRTSVWFMSTRIDGADVASFRYFHGGQCKWGADASHLFCLYVDGRPSVKVVKSKEVDSLRFLDEPRGAYMRQYALTDRRVYYYGRWVRGADPRTFRRMLKDRPGEGSALSDFHRDDRCAYLHGRKLDGVDPDELVIFHMPGLGHEVYAFVGDQVYVADSIPMTRLSPADLNRLQHRDVRDYLSSHPRGRSFVARLGPCSSIEALRAALDANVDIDTLCAGLRGGDEVGETLSAATPADRLRLAGYLQHRAGAHGVFHAAYGFQARGDYETACRLWELVVAMPPDPERDHPLSALNATASALLLHRDQGKASQERSERYLARFSPHADLCSPVLLNLAMLELELDDHEQAVAVLREAVLLGDPQIKRQLAEDEDLAPLRARADFKALATLEPDYPVALRVLQTLLYWGNPAARARAKALGIERFHPRLTQEVSTLYPWADDRRFLCFATGSDGAKWTIWRREETGSNAEHPVVVFDAKDTAHAYADSADGFAARFVGRHTAASMMVAKHYPVTLRDEAIVAQAALDLTRELHAELGGEEQTRRRQR